MVWYTNCKIYRLYPPECDMFICIYISHVQFEGSSYYLLDTCLVNAAVTISDADANAAVAAAAAADALGKDDIIIPLENDCSCRN